MKKVVLTTLSIITLIIGCKKAVEPQSTAECSNNTPLQRANYPISVGSYWIYDTYKVIDSSGVETLIRSSDTTEVIGDTTINGKAYSVFRGIKYPISSTSSLMYNWYLRDSLGLILNNYGTVSNGTWSYSDTINYHEDNAIAQWGSYSATQEQIIVDAGSFNAKRMRIHFMLMNGSAISQCLNDSVSNNAGAEFYTEGVGLVQKNLAYSTMINCEHFESRLKEYHIAP